MGFTTKIVFNTRTRPATLYRECDESLRRLNTDRIDLYYLHAPDPKTPLGESASAIRSLLESGKIRSVGVSNFSLAQLVEFHSVCPISAYQPHYNMLQRECGLTLHFGHGLTYRNVQPVAAIQDAGELNIGHSIVARAIMVGFSQAVREMRELIVEASSVY